MNEPDMYREWDPPASWRHAVVCCWEQRVTSARVQRVLPDGHADVLLHESGLVEVVGVHDEVALPALPAGTRLRGVRVRPWAVAAAFEVPASSLLNRTVAADDVFGAKRARRLGEPEGLDGWIRGVEPDPRIAAAVRLLESHSVDDVASQLGLTGRQLRRIVVAEVGVAPKVFQRVLRFQRFVRAVDGGSTLSAAAADAGYADQPHLTREVRRLAELTPGGLARERRAG